MVSRTIYALKAPEWYPGILKIIHGLSMKIPDDQVGLESPYTIKRKSCLQDIKF
jgi:hypothetical protein